MFIDASALSAILLAEPEADKFAGLIDRAPVKLTSSIAIFEAALALRRQRAHSTEVARALVMRLIVGAKIDIAPLGALEGDIALEAFERFGKGRHPARLNMGDCFAYACARTHGVPLLFKGDDFGLTDIDSA